MSELTGLIKYSFSTAWDILKHEGVVSFFKKGFLYYLPPVILLPWWLPEANKIKKTGSNLKVMNFIYDGFWKIIRPGQIKSEITKLLLIVSSIKPQTILEIGTCRGGTLFIWSYLLSNNGVLVSIDLPYGRDGGGYHLWKVPFYKSFASAKQKIHLLRADSHRPQTLEKLKKILGSRKVDFLFIDGDHSEYGVTSDFNMYSPLIRKGGIIAIHDIVVCSKSSGCHVDRFWKKIKHSYKFEEIIEDKNQKWAGIGVLYL